MNKVLLLLLVSGSVSAQCPLGTLPAVDAWGNAICREQGGHIRSIEGSLHKCPLGAYAWKDSWGNEVCKSSDTGQNFYAPGGCPMGSYPWVDRWGNKVCQSR